MISQSAEDYLKAVYKLQKQGMRVTTSEIARALNVSAASVTNMVKKLARARLLRHTSYHGVELTRSGEKVALEVIRHHRLLELYLKEALGYSWDQVHEEAEKLEHHISEDFEDRMDALLGYPTRDPHGDPIPSKDLIMPTPNDGRMSQMAVGRSAQVSRVSDADPTALKYLAELGIVPDAKVELVERLPFNGPLRYRVGDREHSLGMELADSVFVFAE